MPPKGRPSKKVVAAPVRKGGVNISQLTPSDKEVEEAKALLANYDDAKKRSLMASFSAFAKVSADDASVGAAGWTGRRCA